MPLGVAPHVGAWIEINCGQECFENDFVAPHVGAWIEIVKGLCNNYKVSGRSSRRSVD